MTRARSWIAIYAVLFGVIAAAQGKASFTGTWKIGAPNGDAFAASSMTVAQTDKTLTVTSTSQMGEIKTIYNLDGTEAQSPLDFNGNTIDRTTKAAWDGDTLVLTTTVNFNGTAIQEVRKWSLDAAGTLTEETTRPDFQGGGSPVTSKATYKKS